MADIPVSQGWVGHKPSDTGLAEKSQGEEE